MRGVEAERVKGGIETGRWYDVKVELRGPAIRCYLDGKLVHEVIAKPLPTLFAVAGLKQDAGELILKVVNGSGAPLETGIDLQGVKAIAATGRAIVLTSASPDDENSFDEPRKVAPKEDILQNIGPSFRHTFPAHSATVLRVRAE